MSELFLGLDTETTGFPRKGALIQEGQARVCQLAMILTNSDGKPLAKFSSLIKPDGWQISEGAAKVNGLSNEMCEAYGLNQKYVYQMYLMFAKRCDVIVAHNSNFDKGMMDIEAAYYHAGAPTKDITIEQCKSHKPWHCTMEANRNIPGGKSLENCLQHHCGRSVGANAHDAMVDTEACLEVFFASRARAMA